MDGISADKDNVKTSFHYCALVSAWQKLGFDDETCALLCDMAMDGDRGIAEAMSYKLNLTDTIARGCPDCKLHFHK
jgi:sulfur relay (sulfurtransferase) complex TusBCD TusD component (DsrE family)